MKKYLIVAMALPVYLFSSVTLGVTFDDLVGVYDAKSTEIPIRSVVTVTKVDSLNGHMSFKIEKSPYGPMVCEGNSRIENGFFLTTDAICQGGLGYTHTMDLTQVRNFDHFSAFVHNTMYDATITVYFTRRNSL